MTAILGANETNYSIAILNWLDFMESVLDRAIKHRKWVQGFIKKLGPDARVVGSR